MIISFFNFVCEKFVSLIDLKFLHYLFSAAVCIARLDHRYSLGPVTLTGLHGFIELPDLCC